MEKLELKHLAPYLPYQLRFKTDFDHISYIMAGLEINRSLIILKSVNNAKNRKTIDLKNAIKYNCSPILRPLSDLTKEIEVNGEKFYPLELIGKIIDNEYVGLAEDKDGIIVGKDISPRCGCPYDCDCRCYAYNLFYKDFNFYSTVSQDGNENDIVDEIVHESYLLMQKLFEWHFDVFGLIEKGLAIDINTLNK